MKRKRLLIVIWNMGIGGIQKRVKDVVREVSHNRPDWDVFLLVKFQTSNSFLSEISHLPRVKVLHFTRSHEDSKGMLSVFWILYHYTMIKPQVCWTFLDHLSVLMVLIKYVIFWHRVKLVLNEGVLTSVYLRLNQRRFYWSLLVKWFYRFSDLIIVPTLAVRNDLIKHFGVSGDTVSVIPNWTLFQPITRSVKRVNDIIFIGRFEEEKNVLAFVDLVHALKKDYPKLRACMLGEGSQQKIVSERISRLHLEHTISLKGFSLEVRSHLSQSRLLVVTTRNEGMPNVVLEAACCLVPTVTTHFVGAEEVVINGVTGFIVDDMKSMVKSLFLLLSQRSLSTQMGEAALAHVVKHHHKKTQRRFIQTLLDV